MTKRVRFVKGDTQSVFFSLLGVPYGVMIMEGHKPLLVIDLDACKLHLRNLEKQGLLTNRKVRKVEKAMLKAGLESTAAMFDKVRQFQIPEDYSPLLKFKVCQTPNCPQPLVHGRVFNKDGSCLTQKSIATLEDGIFVSQNLAQNGEGNKLDAVIIFQQMLAADLAVDVKNWTDRYFALPPLFGD